MRSRAGPGVRPDDQVADLAAAVDPAVRIDDVVEVDDVVEHDAERPGGDESEQVRGRSWTFADEFTFGLDLILDGIARHRPRTSGRARR